jgi:hypothetical protein
MRGGGRFFAANALQAPRNPPNRRGAPATIAAHYNVANSDKRCFMIIKPRVRGFICVSTHPTGCEANVREQIDYVKARGPIGNGPKKVLVIGASTGYGLAARISAAFGSDAATLGVFFERAGSETKAGTAGWYNTTATPSPMQSSSAPSKSSSAIWVRSIWSSTASPRPSARIRKAVKCSARRSSRSAVP